MPVLARSLLDRAEPALAKRIAPTERGAHGPYSSKAGKACLYGPTVHGLTRMVVKVRVADARSPTL